MAIGAGEGILAALNGLVDGINKGLDKRRDISNEDKKLQIQRDDLELKRQDHAASLDATKAYRENTLALQTATLEQRKKTEDADTRNKTKKTNADINKIDDKDEDAGLDRELKATDQLNKLNDDRRKILSQIGNIDPASTDQADVQALGIAKQKLIDIDTNIAAVKDIQNRAKVGSQGKKIKASAPAGPDIKGAYDFVTRPEVNVASAKVKLQELIDAGVNTGHPDFVKVVNAIKDKIKAMPSSQTPNIGR